MVRSVRGRGRGPVVPATLLAVVAAYAAVHATLLHGLARAARAEQDAREAVGAPALALPAGTLEWLPVGSTVRFAALAALGVALARAGRRWAVLLPPAVLLVGLFPDGRPLPLDGAWSTALWLWTPATPPESLSRAWAGCALDAALMLLPAVVVLVRETPGRPATSGRRVLVRCLPVLTAVAAAWWWTATVAGAAPAGYWSAALLVVGAGLVASGATARRPALVAVALLPALAVEEWAWPLAGHPEGLASAALAAAAASALALASAASVLLGPAAARRWRTAVRRMPVDPRDSPPTGSRLLL